MGHLDVVAAGGDERGLAVGGGQHGGRADAGDDDPRLPGDLQRQGEREAARRQAELAPGCGEQVELGLQVVAGEGRHAARAVVLQLGERRERRPAVGEHRPLADVDDGEGGKGVPYAVRRGGRECLDRVRGDSADPNAPPVADLVGAGAGGEGDAGVVPGQGQSHWRGGSDDLAVPAAQAGPGRVPGQRTRGTEGDEVAAGLRGHRGDGEQRSVVDPVLTARQGAHLDEVTGLEGHRARWGQGDSGARDGRGDRVRAVGVRPAEPGRRLGPGVEDLDPQQPVGELGPRVVRWGAGVGVDGGRVADDVEQAGAQGRREGRAATGRRLGRGDPDPPADPGARRRVDAVEGRVEQLGRVLGRLDLLGEHVEVDDPRARGRERRDLGLVGIREVRRVAREEAVDPHGPGAHAEDSAGEGHLECGAANGHAGRADGVGRELAGVPGGAVEVEVPVRVEQDPALLHTRRRPAVLGPQRDAGHVTGHVESSGSAMRRWVCRVRGVISGSRWASRRASGPRQAWW